MLKNLTYFVALAEEKNFARAAEACRVAQPTLSIAIRNLESDLAAPLVIRGNRFAGLTAEGELALTWGRRILLDYQSMLRDLSGDLASVSGTLKLGVIPTAVPCSARVARHFRNRHPEASIVILTMDERAIQRGLDLFELDGAITYIGGDALERVCSLPLYDERHVLICNADHHLSARSSMMWSETLGEQICLLEGDIIGERMSHGISVHGCARAAPLITVGSFAQLCSRVRKGSWCGIVPYGFVEDLDDDLGFRPLELRGANDGQIIGLVSSERLESSPITRSLIQAAQEASGAACLAGRTS